MNKVGRFSLFIFIMILILFLGLIFSAWVVPHIVQPASETIWLFLRLFILSVDQLDYWNIISIAALIWIIYRLARRKPSKQPEGSRVKNEIRDNLQNWREFLIQAKHHRGDRGPLRDKLLRLLISHYASRQPQLDQAEIGQGLEQHQLPLPGSVYDFLFGAENQTSGRLSPHAISHPIQRWYQRISGQDETDINPMIDDLIYVFNARVENDHEYTNQ